MENLELLRDYMRTRMDMATEKQLRLMYRAWVQISK